jgi:hypothetical protein
MRAKEGVHHWQGRPGLWRELLPAKEARRIAAAHQAHLQAHGYVCDPNRRLRGRRADERWDALIVRRAPAAEHNALAGPHRPPSRIAVVVDRVKRWL